MKSQPLLKHNCLCGEKHFSVNSSCDLYHRSDDEIKSAVEWLKKKTRYVPGSDTFHLLIDEAFEEVL